MKSEVTASEPHVSSVGDLLRYWRGQRGWSQLDLAFEGGTSQRHLSFVESGRSVPSRSLLVTLSDALNVPLRERNALLLAAGYAPVYAETALDDATMKVVSGAIDQMLRNHEPHPALLMDRYWNVLRTNTAATRLFGSLIDLEAFARPRNLLELTFDPAGLRPHIEDWENFAAGILQRVRREAIGLVIDPRLQLLLDKLRRYPGANHLPVSTSPDGPILPITFLRGEERLSYFSLVTTIGTPQTVTAQELRLECMFPLDPPPRPRP
ncbi:helix-turn-helix domain-containing protein [Silvibacterium sp.]|uniref:helix-turn-helix domain-containing protein n=1 Tax=Silvibacterium sp. TaxID=1964179 RepID=UPI0039E325CE